MSKFVIASSSPLRAALLHSLSLLKVPSQNIVDGPTMRVETSVDAAGFDGLLSVIATLRKEYSSDAFAQNFLGLGSNGERLAANQWVTFASRLASGAAAPVDVETALTLSAIDKNEFLVRSNEPTIADVLLYSALSVESVRTSMAVSRWASLVQAHELIAPITRKSELFPEVVKTAAAEGTTSSTTEGKSVPSYVKPSAEEIEQRRLAKEKAKAEKEKEKLEKGGDPAAATTAAAAAPPAAAKKGGNAALESTELDIRVGKIVSIARHPEADKLFVETMDLGPNEPQRTIVSGLVDHYSAEDLVNQLVLVVCNLKPKPLKGVASHGMVLCASNETGLKIVSPPAGTVAGERVSFGGKLNPVPPPVPSNAGTVELLSHLRTDENGVVCWKTQQATVAAGLVTNDLKSSVVK